MKSRIQAINWSLITQFNSRKRLELQWHHYDRIILNFCSIISNWTKYIHLSKISSIPLEISLCLQDYLKVWIAINNPIEVSPFLSKMLFDGNFISGILTLLFIIQAGKGWDHFYTLKSSLITHTAAQEEWGYNSSYYSTSNSNPKKCKRVFSSNRWSQSRRQRRVMSS